jgi:iron complex outermembrane receptor protein
MVMLSGAAFVAISAGAASAQEAPDGQDRNEIIVTAQKRSENIQDVPISIAAFSGAQMEQANVADIADLGRVASNFSVTKPGQAANVRISVRGIASSSNTATEPSVASFVDGIYMPRPGAVVTSFLDMSAVEILRGPQGTLFGRNASVGALSLRTAEPEFRFSGRLTGEIGNADRYKVDGYVNVPLSENVAVRVAALKQWFGGYWFNRLDGKQFGGADDFVTRASIKAEFGNITWLLRGDYAETKGDGGYNADFIASSVSPAQLEALKARLGGQLPDTEIGDRNANFVRVGDLRDKQWGVSSDLSLDTSGGFTFRLINSYRDWKSRQLDGDLGYVPVPLVTRNGDYDSESQSHELQIISPRDELLGGKLDFVAGLYYFEEDYRIGEGFNLQSDFCNFAASAANRPACTASLVNPGGDGATDLQFFQNVKSYAAYGQSTIHLTDRLDATLGVRYTRDRKRGLFDQKLNNSFGAALRAVELTPLSLNDSKVTWRANLSYRPTDDLMVFATYSTGYKSGGFNSSGGNAPLGQRRLFDREEVDNYEFGVKSNWLDDTLQANVTLYRMDIGGYQDRGFDGTSFVVRNAGSLRQQGAEFDLILRPVRDFSVTASLAYLDSKFTSYEFGPPLPGLTGTQNLKGKRVAFAPEFTGNVAAEWRGDIGSGLEWRMNGNLSFLSDYYSSVNDGNPQTIMDGFAQIGARFSIGSIDERWTLALFGNNLTNKSFCSSTAYQLLDGAFGVRNGVFPGSTAIRCIHGEPRTYGASATIRF